LGPDGVDTERVEQACKQLGYNFTLAPKGIVAEQASRIDILLDVGDFGWEPTLYVLAHNPLDLIDRTHQILSAL
jgi:predicted fused transcriptional regulator/phosphomethylpyrimidine kinase